MGHFLTFEGLDGSGKTTQLELLATRLRQAGEVVVTTREPGGTRLGERIRGVFLGQEQVPEAELALMVASRAQSVREVIVPALERGQWVLCDRFHDATEAYQGGGRGLPCAMIRELHRLLCRDLQPALTLVLELDPATSLKRAQARADADTASGGRSRIEREGEAFYARVATAYRDIAAREPARCRLVPAQGSAADVAIRIAAEVEPFGCAGGIHAV